jgi:hypothetical protein
MLRQWYKGNGGRGAEGKKPPVNVGVDNINNKFWEELIDYFHLIQHGPHRKRQA